MTAAAGFGSGWFDQVGAWPVADVARRLGLEVERRGASISAQPCPLCGDSTRHHKSRDRRGAVGFRPDGTGWRCFQCDAHGDAVALAAACVVQKASGLSPDEWASVRRACAERGLCDPDPRDNRPAPAVRYVPPAPKVAIAPTRPDRSEVLALWAAGVKPAVAAAKDEGAYSEAAAYLTGRGVNLGDLDLYEPEMCRILPAPGAHSFPSWWPERWAVLWRWAVLAYEANGDVGSIHARAVGPVPEDAPKTRWPKGDGALSAAGLLFANARGSAVLRGDQTDAEAVMVTEGLTDTVAASVFFAADGHRFAVLGVTSGSAKAFKAVRWPSGLACLVATDNDEAGDRYAAEIRAALPRAVEVKRVRFGREA